MRLAGTGARDVKHARALWDLDPAVRHLNHGSFGAVPSAIFTEQDRLRRLVEFNPVRWFSELPNRVRIARLRMASLLETDPDRLAFVLNASAGASVVFQALSQQGPVDVMTTNHGYGAITMGAERLAHRTGGRADSVSIPLAATASEVTDLVTAALRQSRPTLLVMDQVTSATAREFPVDEICVAAREMGVLTLVDGAHAPGVLRDPVCKEADYWVGNLHKFICSPRGAAVLVSRGTGQELFPSIDSWGTPLAFPERFDVQGTLDATPWITAPLAWEYMEESFGWDTIRQTSSAILDEGCDTVARSLRRWVEDPLPDVGQPVGPMRLLRLPGQLGGTISDADALRVPFMDATGVVAAFTSFDGRGFIRLSSHIYTIVHDFEQFASIGIPLLRQWSESLPLTITRSNPKLRKEQLWQESS